MLHGASTVALTSLFEQVIDVREAFEISWQDGMIWTVAFVVTICGGVTAGMGAGVGFSLLLVLCVSMAT
jgi:hypothetical protein